jgi:hypothetical protein
MQIDAHSHNCVNTRRLFSNQGKCSSYRGKSPSAPYIIALLLQQYHQIMTCCCLLRHLRWHWHFVAAISEEEALQWMSYSRDSNPLNSELENAVKKPSKKRTAASIDCNSSAQTCSPEDSPNFSEVKDQFSSSVSFWWGKRILKS